MAFAAATSLIQILKQLMLPDQSSIPYPESHIESLYSKVSSLQSFLEENITAQSTSQAAVADCETQIRDAIYKAEDIVESHISRHLRPYDEEDRPSDEEDSGEDPEFFSQDIVESHISRNLRPSDEEGSGEDPEIFSQKLQELLQELDSIQRTPVTTAEDLGQESLFAPAAPPLEQRKLVGLTDALLELKEKLIGESSRLEVVAVVGMAGIGKTTLIHQVYHDPSLQQIFHYRAWATVGPHGYVRLTDSVYRNLKGRRYLVVLDGLFDINVLDDLKSSFPNDDNGSRILLTTRLGNVATDAAGTNRNIHQMSFLGKDESWDLLQNTAFPGGFSCPPELLKIGKTVAENCQGLPLTIVLVGTILSGAEKTLEYWKKVADNPISAIFNSNDLNLKSQMQVLNDDNLPQHLRACFLYMGVFPLNYEIQASKLIKLWVSEGFLKQRDSKSPEKVAEKCLEELVDRSLVLVHKRSSIGGIKSCSVHSAVWHLCVNAADKDMFFSDIKTYDCEASPESTSIDGGRRLCVRKNILFGIGDVHKTMQSVKKSRSLLCMGPEYSIPLPVCLKFRLLRVLDALTIHFDKLQIIEIKKLIQLRYLALTCKSGELPAASLEKLWNLQVLIIRRYLSIKSPRTPSCLPIEIWKMKYLRHLHLFMGADLPDPGDAVLQNLLTLSNVGGRSCTMNVFKGTPCLKNLGICIEFKEDAALPLPIFDHIELLSQLESFKCVIRHPDLEANLVSRPVSVSNFPSTLRKITLSGCGFPWEDMKILAMLPEIEVLKLRCHAFQGTNWKLHEDEFIRLKHLLLLEDLDLEHWTADGQVLRGLERLIIQHCYNLREIPDGVDYSITLRALEVVECSPSVVDSAMRIREMQEDLSNDDLRVSIHCSWNERTTKA